MSEEGRKEQAASAANAVPPGAESAAAGASAGGAGATPDVRDERIKQLEAQVGDLKQQLLRATADYQNLARRSLASSAEAREQQLMEVARTLLTVLDHFDLALRVDPAKVTTASLLQGVQIVRNEMGKMLEQFGIVRIEARVGEEFDPHYHEAMMRQQVEGIAANHVTAQLAPGYRLGERTLRPAKVAVA